MLFLQYLQRPLEIIKERIGKRSYHSNVFLQCGQYDLPQNDFLTKLLSANTKQKLPNISPIKKPNNPTLVSTTST